MRWADQDLCSPFTTVHPKTVGQMLRSNSGPFNIQSVCRPLDHRGGMVTTQEWLNKFSLIFYITGNGWYQTHDSFFIF
jgi:hypothetical protein